MLRMRFQNVCFVCGVCGGVRGQSVCFVCGIFGGERG